jgi:hypothetical protein
MRKPGLAAGLFVMVSPERAPRSLRDAQLRQVGGDLAGDDRVAAIGD